VFSYYRATSGKEDAQEVIDVFAIPDYDRLFDQCIDAKFGRCFKEELTQHQFCFEAVPVCSTWPHGVKVTTRRYATEKYIEVAPDSSSSIGLSAKIVVSPWYGSDEGSYIRVLDRLFEFINTSYSSTYSHATFYMIGYHVGQCFLKSSRQVEETLSKKL
jgi:hypothetical protein